MPEFKDSIRLSDLILRFYKDLFSFNSALDCLSRADFFASSAADTLCTVRVIHRVHFHLACFCTFSTVNTLFHIYSITVNGNTIKYRIKSSQRADIFTKWTIYYNRKDYRNHKNRVLPYKKPSDCTAHRLIQ